MSVESGGNVDADLRIWDPATGEDKRVIRGGKTYFNARFTPDAKHLIAGGAGHVIDVWDASTGTFIHSLAEHDADIMAISISKDGSRMVSVTLKNEIILWDLPTFQLLDRFTSEGLPEWRVGQHCAQPGRPIARGAAEPAAPSS